mmetsp:Transcript_64765/g.154665  ORF Transcript_64765/g.154665 Transcript_64765/m.154665 type:complete len:270 (+) Transcript_64765:1059-1868(+)
MALRVANQKQVCRLSGEDLLVQSPNRSADLSHGVMPQGMETNRDAHHSLRRRQRHLLIFLGSHCNDALLARTSHAPRKELFYGSLRYLDVIQTVNGPKGALLNVIEFLPPQRLELGQLVRSFRLITLLILLVALSFGLCRRCLRCWWRFSFPLRWLWGFCFILPFAFALWRRWWWPSLARAFAIAFACTLSGCGRRDVRLRLALGVQQDVLELICRGRGYCAFLLGAFLSAFGLARSVGGQVAFPILTTAVLVLGALLLLTFNSTTSLP